MADKKIILADIATRLNISKMTVSRALNGQNGVGEALCKEIRSIASDMGYSFERLRSGGEKRKYVYVAPKRALVEPDGYFYERYSLLKNICTEENHDLVFHILETEDEQQGILPAEFNDADGLICNGIRDNIFIDRIDSLGIPYVTNALVTQKGADCVVMDEYFYMSLITEYLYEKGYRKIGYVGGSHKSFFEKTNSWANNLQLSRFHTRINGFLHIIAKRELPFKKEWIINNYDPETDFYTLDYTLPKPLPEAFICYSDRTTWYFMEKLKSEKIKVPDDTALISFANNGMLRKFNPPLTALETNMELSARETLKLLDERIKGRTKARRIYLDSEIIEGYSTPDINNKKRNAGIKTKKQERVLQWVLSPNLVTGKEKK